MSQDWDAIIVGGGAAGFFGAITCATSMPSNARVLILERSNKVLNKVKISGGGRCNVTHDCYDPKEMATKHYPRGNKALIGPMYRFGVAETVQWFARRGVELKTEADGRKFPVTDDSQTVIDCLRDAANDAGVVVRTGAGVLEINRTRRGPKKRFELVLKGGEKLTATNVLVATGGTRLSSSAALAKNAGHRLKPAVPSLFTFHIDDPRIDGLPGLSVDHVEVGVVGRDLTNDGPILITHRGLSGPAILKLSSWGARELNELGYRFTLNVDWLPGRDIKSSIHRLRHDAGKRQVGTRSPFDELPNRLWKQLVDAADVDPSCRWAELPGKSGKALKAQLRNATFEVTGKSTNKDEFVTCGGVRTDDVDMRTMESVQSPGIFFAGEVLNIDGVTGGFNFQSAWTTGYLAGSAMAGEGR